jgi:hypothetical protein
VKRIIPGIIAGIAAWILAVSLLDRGLRLGLSGYAVAEPDMTFTLPMMVARLTIGALASLIAGAVAGWIDRRTGPAVWIVGVMLLAAFIPRHVAIWHMLPVWYHLTFLVTLVPLMVLGSLLARASAPPRSAGTAQQA